MIFGINTTRDISKLSQITYNNFEISLVVFMPNIATNHAITYTYLRKRNNKYHEIKIEIVQLKYMLLTSITHIIMYFEDRSRFKNLIISVSKSFMISFASFEMIVINVNGLLLAIK